MGFAKPKETTEHVLKQHSLTFPKEVIAGALFPSLLKTNVISDDAKMRVETMFEK